MQQDQRPTMPPIWTWYSLTTRGHSSTFANEADLAFVERLPAETRQGQRLIAMFARLFAYYLKDHGFTCAADIGAGVPEPGSLHDILGKEAKVLYNDISPDVLLASQEFIEGYPNVVYTNYDIRNPAPVIAAMHQLFGRNTPIGLSGCGLFYFLTDAEARLVLRAFFEACPPGSPFGITNFDVPKGDQVLEKAKGDYRNRGLQLYPRSIEHMTALLTDAGWQPLDGGLAPVENQIARLRGGNFKNILEDPNFAERVGSAGLFIHP